MILRSIWLLATGLATMVAAAPKFTKPAAGATVAAGTISIAWEDSDETPPISQLTTYQLFLVGGGNEETKLMNAILVTNGQFATGNTATGSIAPGFAGEAKNGFYLKMVAVATQGGTMTIYSKRFSVTGMTGVFPPDMQTAIEAIDGADDVPEDVNNIVNTQQNIAGGGDPNAPGEYGIDYALQTGRTKFAPMPPVPSTKITKDKPSRLYPTSAFNIATTKLPPAFQIWTNTMSATFSAASKENTVAPASMPTDTAMAKYLNRWKD